MISILYGSTLAEGKRLRDIDSKETINNSPWILRKVS